VRRDICSSQDHGTGPVGLVLLRDVGSMLRVPLGACGVVGLDINGEFDPGSGRTLAACLTHASRTVKPLRGWISGERVSNT
jgi:hypothetical protein